MRKRYVAEQELTGQLKTCHMHEGFPAVVCTKQQAICLRQEFASKSYMSSCARELTWTTIGLFLEFLFGVKKADCATTSRITASITAVNKNIQMHTVPHLQQVLKHAVVIYACCVAECRQTQRQTDRQTDRQTNGQPYTNKKACR